MKNHNWHSLQNDPDNWIEIPEFHILPREVNFEGFAYPILAEKADDFLVLVPIQETVSRLRHEARNRFSTLAALKNAYSKVVIEATEFDDNFIPISVSPNEAFATRYEILMSTIKLSVQYRRGSKKNESSVHLARIASLLADMIGGASLSEADIRKIRSEQGRKGAAAKLATDPKQADKAQVRECWELWQKEPTRYKWKTTFAKDMMDKYPALESVAVITRWCKDWESEAS